MFEHTHRNNAVKMTGLMAIVTQVKIKLVLSAAEITLFIGKVKLAFGQGDAGYMRLGAQSISALAKPLQPHPMSRTCCLGCRFSLAAMRASLLT